MLISDESEVFTLIIRYNCQRKEKTTRELVATGSVAQLFDEMLSFLDIIRYD